MEELYVIDYIRFVIQVGAVIVGWETARYIGRVVEKPSLERIRMRKVGSLRRASLPFRAKS